MSYETDPLHIVLEARKALAIAQAEHRADNIGTSDTVLAVCAATDDYDDALQRFWWAVEESGSEQAVKDIARQFERVFK